MSDRGNYVEKDEMSVQSYEVYEQDLSEFGAGEVSFNSEWIPMGQRSWFRNVISGQFNKVAHAAYEAGKAEVRMAMKKALGL